MVDRVLMTNGYVKVSKPGIDVNTATEDQLLLGIGLYPQMIIDSGTCLSGANQSTWVNPVVFEALPFIPAIIWQGNANSGDTYAQLPHYTRSSVVRWTRMRPQTDRFDFQSTNNRKIFYIVLNYEAHD